jgi:FMN phosphatase YigB (HAD superfamily)
MIDNQDPTRTLKEAFDARFYPALGTTEEALRDDIDRFYSKIYPELRELTNQVPGAAEFLEKVAKEKLQIAIATNPLFPQTAIRQRLQWSGIDPADDRIQLITSYEHFHFAKPKPAYYAEILGWLGVPAEAAVMIGDDPENDLKPAIALGLPSFKIALDSEGINSEHDLQAAWSWLQKQIERTQNTPTSHSPTALLARMRGYLAALQQRMEQLSTDEWTRRPSDREWSPLEIICHLRDTEKEVNYPRLHLLLTDPTPFLSAANPDEWADERNYQHQDPAQALAEFSAARQQTIARLANLSVDQWETPARHSLLGPTTLAEVLSVAADHDLLHLKQLRETITAIKE